LKLNAEQMRCLVGGFSLNRASVANGAWIDSVH
jgi:hypothetical protein